jgi:hypothetical protein
MSAVSVVEVYAEGNSCDARTDDTLHTGYRDSPPRCNVAKKYVGCTAVKTKHVCNSSLEVDLRVDSHFMSALKELGPIDSR